MSWKLPEAWHVVIYHCKNTWVASTTFLGCLSCIGVTILSNRYMHKYMKQMEMWRPCCAAQCVVEYFRGISLCVAATNFFKSPHILLQIKKVCNIVVPYSIYVENSKIITSLSRSPAFSLHTVVVNTHLTKCISLISRPSHRQNFGHFAVYFNMRLLQQRGCLSCK